MEYEKLIYNSERWFDLTPLLNEEFKDIQDYEGLYQISNYGRVKSLYKIDKNNHSTPLKILRLYKHGTGDNQYLVVNLSNGGKEKVKYVHRLVAQTFISNPQDKPQVNHEDGCKFNNCVYNLQWCTNGENQRHALRNGLKKPATGLNCGNTRKVVQYTKNNEVVKVWDYITLASKKLNIKLSNIINCCQNKIPSAGGYKWKYYEEKEN